MTFFYNMFIRSGFLKGVVQTISTAILWLIIGGYLFDNRYFIETRAVIFSIGFGMALTYFIWHWSWSISLTPHEKSKHSDSSAEAMAILISHLTEEERLNLRDRLVYRARDDGEILPAFDEAEQSISNHYS